MAGKLDVEIVTGERVVFEDHDVDMVVAPGGAGVLGILPQHAPLITTLSFGELRIKKGNAEESIAGRQGTMDLEEAQASLRRANLRLRIGQRRGSRRTPVPSGEGFPGSGS